MSIFQLVPFMVRLVGYQYVVDPINLMLSSAFILGTFGIGGFNPLAAVFGLLAFVVGSQFFFYGINDPADK